MTMADLPPLGRRGRVGGLILAALAAVLAGCGITAPPTLPPSATVTQSPTASPSPSASPAAPLKLVHDPGHVTGTVTGPCFFRDSRKLPDPRCTPGAIDPAVTAAVLCAPGYSTRSYRPPSSQTDAAKWDTVAPAYGIPRGTEGELDHLVPLTLGGANDLSNLWIEQGTIPNAKDHLEVALHRAVCDGQVTLADAQHAIAANWETAESTLGIGG